MEWLQIVWFGLLAVLFAGYSVLDGFDLGLGILAPYLAREEQDKRMIFNAVGPFWDGNEVWLLAGGGALFAAFPPVYATLFSGMYIPLMLVLFALIFRAVSLEFWAYDTGYRTFWFWAFVAGSTLASLLFGVALGNILMGIPLTADGDYAGSFFTFLRMFPLLCALLGCAALAMHGAAYAILKTSGPVEKRARSARRFFHRLFLPLFVVTVILGALEIPGAATKPLAWIGVGAVCIMWFAAGWTADRGRAGFSFLFSSLVQVGFWFLIAVLMFPVLVRALETPELNLTLYNSSSSRLTLTVMLIIALIGMPVVIVYTLFVYRAFIPRQKRS